MNITNDFRSKLLQEDLFNQKAEEYAEQIKKVKNIVIWGCASTGQSVYDFLKEFEAHGNVKYFADNSKQKWGTRKNGLLVLSPEEVVNQVRDNPDTYIIIAALHLVDIRKQLLSLGIQDSTIDTKGFGLARDYLTFRNESPYKIIYSHLEEYEKVYSYLSDDRSKAVYLGILNCKMSLDNKYMQGIASPPKDQYFDKDIVNFSENEVFCDCGSFNGDTLETFIGLTGDKYKKYIAIEADGDIYVELNEKVREKGLKNVQTYNLACWNEKTVLKFQSEQMAGRVTEVGSISVQADALDNFLKDEQITYLKMDIEGAEEMALKGASKLIQKDKPILGICIYHSLEDYYKLPLLMKELNQDYRLFIRNYTDMVDTETVCYAVPRERLVVGQ